MPAPEITAAQLTRLFAKAAAHPEFLASRFAAIGVPAVAARLGLSERDARRLGLCLCRTPEQVREAAALFGADAGALAGMLLVAALDAP